MVFIKQLWKRLTGSQDPTTPSIAETIQEDHAMVEEIQREEILREEILREEILREEILREEMQMEEDDWVSMIAPTNTITQDPLTNILPNVMEEDRSMTDAFFSQDFCINEDKSMNQEQCCMIQGQCCMNQGHCCMKSVCCLNEQHICMEEQNCCQKILCMNLSSIEIVQKCQHEQLENKDKGTDNQQELEKIWQLVYGKNRPFPTHLASINQQETDIDNSNNDSSVSPKSPIKVSFSPVITVHPFYPCDAIANPKLLPKEKSKKKKKQKKKK